MIKKIQSLAARFNDNRRVERISHEALIDPVGVISGGEDEHSRIIFGAMDSAERILKERYRLDREGRADEPLVVVIGEQHDYPAHYLHHMLVLKTLQQSGEKTVCGLENRDSIVTNWLRYSKGYDEDDSVLYSAYNEANENGGIGLMYVYAGGEPTLAPYAQKVFQRNLIDSGIPVRFTDAALVYKSTENGTHSEEQCLDPYDPQTKQSMEECWVEREKDFSPYEPDGIWIRNHHAARLIEDFADNQNARILVQFSGNAHVLGKNDGLDPVYLPGTESLSAGIKERKLPVMAIVLNNRDFHQAHIPDNHRLDTERQVHILEGLPDFKYAQNTHFFEEIFVSKEQEWVDDMLRSVGMAGAILTIDDPRWASTPDEFQDKLARFDRIFQHQQADKMAGIYSGGEGFTDHLTSD